MQIKDVMATEPLSVRTDATIQEAAAGMRDAGVGALPVVTDAEELAGIVTDRDIALRAVAEGRGPETLVERGAGRLWPRAGASSSSARPTSPLAGSRAPSVFPSSPPTSRGGGSRNSRGRPSVKPPR